MGFETGQFQVKQDDTQVVVTGLSGQPKAIVFIGSYVNFFDVDNVTILGFGTSSDPRNIRGYANEAGVQVCSCGSIGASYDGGYGSSRKSGVCLFSAGANFNFPPNYELEGTLTSFDSNGFTISLTTNAIVGAQAWFFIAFYDADYPKLTEIDLPFNGTVNRNYDYNLNQNSHTLWIMGNGESIAGTSTDMYPDFGTDGFVSRWGDSVGMGNKICQQWGSNNASSDLNRVLTTVRNMNTSNNLRHIQPASTLMYSGTPSWYPNGVRELIGAVSTLFTMNDMFLTMPEYISSIGTFNTSTSLSTPTTVNVGFQPDLVIYLSAGIPAAVGINTAACSGFRGYVSAQGRFCHGFFTRNLFVFGLNTHPTLEVASRNHDIWHLSTATQTSFQGVTTLTSTGFTINYSTVTGTANSVGYVAMKARNKQKAAPVNYLMGRT